MPIQAIICEKCGNAAQAIANRVECLDAADAIIGECRIPYKVMYLIDCPQCGVGTQVRDVSVDVLRCPTPNCGSPFIHARGLCHACYNVYEELVSQGVVTWQALEQRGIVQ